MSESSPEDKLVETIGHELFINGAPEDRIVDYASAIARALTEAGLVAENSRPAPAHRVVLVFDALDHIEALLTAGGPSDANQWSGHAADLRVILNYFSPRSRAPAETPKAWTEEEAAQTRQWNTQDRGLAQMFCAALQGITANPAFFGPVFQQSPTAAIQFADEVVMAFIANPKGEV